MFIDSGKVIHRIFFFMLTSFILIASCLLVGKVYISSTDNIWFWSPIIETIHDNIRNGEFGFWNPYILGGFDNTSNTYYTPYTPEYLLIALVPKHLIYHALTLIFFIHVWLIGVFGYLLLRNELRSEKWGFAAAIVYQLSGWTVWTLTSPIATASFLYFTIALYIIWTLNERSRYLSFIFLTLSLSLLLLTGNMVISFWGIIGLVALFVYRYGFPGLEDLKPFNGGYFLFLISLASAFLISAVHLLPVLVSLPMSVRLPTTFGGQEYMSNFPVILRLFDPEIFGVNYTTSAIMFKNLGMLPRHIHNIFPLYFGVLPALLMIWGVITSRNSKLLFWMPYFIIAASISGFLQPFAKIYEIFAFPFIHHMGVEMLMPVSISVVFGLMGMELENREQGYTGKQMSLFGFILSIIIIWFALVWLGQKPQYVKTFQMIIYAFSFLIIFFMILYNKRPKIFNYAGTVFLFSLIAAVLAVVLYIFIGNNPLFEFIRRDNFHTSSIIWFLSGFLFFGYYWIIYNSGKTERAFIAPLSVFALVVFLFGLIMDKGMSQLLIPARGIADFFIASLGTVRFVVIACLLVLAISKLSLENFRRNLYWLFLCIVIIDLAVSFKINEKIIMFPAHYKEHILPDVQGQKNKGDTEKAVYIEGDKSYSLRFEDIDRINYRVNNSFAFFIKSGEMYSKYFAYAPSDLEFNTPANYKLKTYSGIPHVLPADLSYFMDAFYPGSFGQGYPNNFTDDRFLDLLSVRYDFLSEKGLAKERKSALSRFMLYFNFQYSNLNTAMPILKNPAFDIHKFLLVNEQDESLRNILQTGEPASQVLLTEEKSDTLNFKIKADKNGLLLFNDNYSPGWKAYINGAKQKILRVNFNKMGIYIPSGENHILLKFRPPVFNKALLITIFGLIVAAAVSIALHLSRNRNILNDK